MVECYADSNLADQVDGFHCTWGYHFTVAGNPVCWRSKKARGVSLSSCDSEVIAACEAVREAMWLRCLLEEQAETAHSNLRGQHRNHLPI